MEGMILPDVRSACNLEKQDDSFDEQLIPLINSQLMMAHEFGIGPSGFVLRTKEETWEDWLGAAADKLAAAQTWLGYRVLLLFDPPDNATVLKAYQETLDKMEWMLCSKSTLEGHASQIYPVEYTEED